MMKIVVASMLLVFAVGSTASAYPRIEIDHDANDCVDGWISMDVSVYVDGENFKFDPSCSFSFNQSFTTSAGIACEAAAGMCSSFSPYNAFEVKCDGGSESVTIACPAK